MSDPRSAIAVLAAAAIAGAVAGVAGSGVAPSRKAAAAGVERIAVAARPQRARPPQAGDRWGGCNDARAAGTAPIYRDEPGYAGTMDGDDDGVACEPVP